MGGEPEGSGGDYVENRERWAPSGSQGTGKLVLWGDMQDDAVRGDDPSSPSLEQSAF